MLKKNNNHAKQWRLDNPEKVKQYRRQYNIDNDKERKNYQKQWRLDNCERIEQYSKDHKEEAKQWRIIHRKEMNQYHRQYQKSDIGKANAQRGNSKRRARIRGIINTLTAQEWLDILEQYNYACVYCRIEFNCENLPERDHVIPISKGGNNTKENVVPACRNCNARKHNKILKKEGE